MTTKTINGREFLFVEVPEEAVKFKISGTGYPCYLKDNSWHVCEPVNLSSEYVIIGKASKLTEEDWRGIVDEMNEMFIEEPYPPYKEVWAPIFTSYTEAMPFVATATESGQSLIQSLGMEPATTLIIEKVK